jgi:hypothetical protein
LNQLWFTNFRMTKFQKNWRLELFIINIKQSQDWSKDSSCTEANSSSL